MSGAGSVLVAEDDTAARELLGHLLRKAGYEVDLAADGQAALEKLERGKYDLLLTDLQMPGLGGRELLRHITEGSKDTDVIVISAVGSIAVAVEAVKSGAFDFIEKPFNLDDVRQKLAQVFEARAERRAALKDASTLDQNPGRTSRPPARDVLERVGRYVLETKIGSGGMGQVYTALDPVIGRKVAVKVLKPEAEAERRHELLARFQRESWAGGKLTHPSIVTVFDFGEDERSKCLYLVMELFGDGSLRDVLKRDKKLDPERAIAIAYQIADGLAHAHRHGVVHRDVKPENVLLDAQDRVKIVDFGIARTPVSDLTLEGRLLGSPRYLAPEMAAGLPIDYRADQFSLGTVLIEMLTGTQVFNGETIYEVLAQVRESKPQPVKKLGARVTRDLQKLIDRLHHKDPAGRFEDELELLEWLRDEARRLRLSLPPPSRH